jgi:hypothetical protein
MDDILHLKLVVNNTLVDMQKDPSGDLKVPLSNLFTVPLVRFEDAYDEFVAAIGQSSDAYDRWLSLQFSLVTDFGPNRETLIRQFSTLYKDTIKSSPGGESVTFTSTFDNQSYQLALILRVYGAGIAFEIGEVGR